MSCVGLGAVKDGYGNVVNFKLVATVRDVQTITPTPTRGFAVYSLNTNKWTLAKSPIFRIDRPEERAGSVFFYQWSDLLACLVKRCKRVSFCPNV